DEKQRLELYRDMLCAHLGAVSSELDATTASIGAIRAALVGQYAVTQASPRPVEALTMPCPACGQPSVPQKAAAAGRGWRKGWYECLADECGTAWSARWSGGAHPAVRMEIGRHTSELQSQSNLVCRLLLEKKKKSSQQR